MSHFLCATCGTQYAESAEPPVACAICEDERQYVGLGGQQWTTLEDLRTKHHNEVMEMEPGLAAILTKPAFAIGQRAFVVETSGGNVLWDCVALLDEATITEIRGRGGLAAIAISHPHYYTTMVEWSRAFGGIPIYLHGADARWIMRPDESIRLWEGDRQQIAGGLTLVRSGGHFEGGAMLHWSGGAGGAGVLLSGDIVQVVPDRRWVSFMYSYPNLIPLPAAAVMTLRDSVADLAFDRVYGAFHPLQVMQDGKGAVERSAARYLRAIGG
jgi:hypothetical protein